MRAAFLSNEAFLHWAKPKNVLSCICLKENEHQYRLISQHICSPSKGKYLSALLFEMTFNLDICVVTLPSCSFPQSISSSTLYSSPLFHRVLHLLPSPTLLKSAPPFKHISHRLPGASNNHYLAVPLYHAQLTKTNEHILRI